MAVQGISWSGVVVRIVLAMALVLASYNPSGHSFYHWLTDPPAGITAVKTLLGVLLLIGWAVSLRTVFVALGWLGVILGVALLSEFAVRGGVAGTIHSRYGARPRPVVVADPGPAHRAGRGAVAPGGAKRGPGIRPRGAAPLRSAPGQAPSARPAWSSPAGDGP
jgi:hypothetical protein